MNKTISIFKIFGLLGLIILLGCEKDETNSNNHRAYGKLKIVYGDNQAGYFGELLSDSIIIKASSNSKSRRYIIKYEMFQGNGSIEGGYYNFGDGFYIDSTGVLEIKWRLGCNYSFQKIKLLLYVDSTKSENGYIYYHHEPSDSIIISASGTRPIGWGRSCGCNNIDFYDSKIISFDESTLYLVSRGLYSSMDSGLNWNKVEGIPDWENIVDAQFNSLGWLYILTQDYGICYSTDLQNWEYINNGILDHRYPTSFLVEDSTLFVSFDFDGLYKTSNNGGFWRKIIVGGDAQSFYHISRHPNGDIYLFDDWGDLWISKNFSKTWEHIDIEYKYIISPIRDLEISEDGFLFIGAGDATISKISPDTYTGELHKFYEMNHSTQHVEDIKIINNTVYFTIIGNPTPGIYSSQNWHRLELGFDDQIYNYYLKKDGSFLIHSYDGIYYYNE